MGLFLPEGVAELGNVLKDLFVDLEVINDITADLQTNEDEIHHTGFQRYQVSQTAFGDSTPGSGLAYHHELAHAKVSDTIAAVLKDLEQFRDGLKTFAKAVDDADSQTADDMRRRHQAVLALDQAADFHHTQVRNHHYHPDQPLPAEPGGDVHA